MAILKSLFSVFLPILVLFSVLLISQADSASPSRRALKMTQTDTISQFLNAHNGVRARHGLPYLKWSPALANYAKMYGNKRRGDCRLIHSTANYGENIFWGKGKNWKPADAVAAWAAQEAYFNYNANRCLPGKECLHYTQLVWRRTQKVGCAMLKCNDGDTLVICEYDPHGNTQGQKPY